MKKRIEQILAFINVMIYDHIIGQAHLFSYDIGLDKWDVYDIGLLSQQALAYLFIFYLIDYKYIVLKTMVFIFMLSEIADIVQFQFIDANNIAPFISVLVFVPWLIYAIYRPYDKPNIEPQKDTIYLISKKPDNFWTFIPSLFTGTSGYSILCNGARYGFSHGSFKIIDFDSQDYQFVTATSIKYKPELINYLASKQGAKWTLFDNCVTVHFKLKWMDWHV